MLIAATTVHTGGSISLTEISQFLPYHLIRQLENQEVISKTHSSFNSPIVTQKSSGEWRLTVDYCGLNEDTTLLSNAISDMLIFQNEVKSKAVKCYAKSDIASAFFFSIFGSRVQATVCFHLDGCLVLLL